MNFFKKESPGSCFYRKLAGNYIDKKLDAPYFVRRVKDKIIIIFILCV